MRFFLFRDFLAIGSWEGPLHSHGAKIGTKIIRAGLHHSLLDGSKLFFVYKEFDLYRSLAIPVNLSLVRSEKLYCVCWILQFGLEEFRIHFNVLIK